MPGRYKDNKITTRFDNKLVYTSTIYPEVELKDTDIYLTTRKGDRLDLLSFKYYGNVQDWWLIAIANNLGNNGSLHLKPGEQIRIPTDIDSIIQEYNRINNV